MARVEGYVCDGCGKRRDNDVNRWWSVNITENHYSILVFSFKPPALEGQFQYCGEQCLLNRFQQFLAGPKGDKANG